MTDGSHRFRVARVREPPRDRSHRLQWRRTAGVLFAAVLIDPGDDIRVHVDVFNIGELRDDVFATLVELSLDILILGADSGVDGG